VGDPGLRFRLDSQCWRKLIEKEIIDKEIKKKKIEIEMEVEENEMIPINKKLLS
jgi:hypothetical protein